MERNVSEKTLELNVTSEILEQIRHLPGCRGAFWLGMTQKQEARCGLDELVKNVPHGLHLMLQFKAPSASSEWRFTVSTAQTVNLLRLSAKHPDAVYFVLPALNKLAHLSGWAPNLLKRVAFLRVEDFRPHIGSGHAKSHAVTLLASGYAQVRSKLFKVKIKTAEQVFSLMPFDMEEKLLTSKDIKGWLNAEGQSSDIRVGNLRGLGSVVFTCNLIDDSSKTPNNTDRPAGL